LAGRRVNPGRSKTVKLVLDVTDPAVAGKQPTHFQRNPPGRGKLAVFLPPRRIDTYDSDIGASLAP
jgi:hypothetical protein